MTAQPPDTAPAAAPTTVGGYRPDIDGLRAVAVLAVVVYHLNGRWLPGGFVGVDVFFVISGYVVTASLQRRRAESLARFVAAFYARRLARIIPALVLMLVVTALLATAFIPQGWLSEHSDDTARYAFFGLSNWALQNSVGSYFAPRTEFNAFTHTWSLGVEEQFYVVAPIALYIWWWTAAGQRISRTALIAAGMVSIAASFALCMWGSRTHPTMAFYFIGSRLWELAAGSLLVLLTSNNPHGAGVARRRRQAAWPAWAGAGTMALSLLFADTAAFPWPWAVPAVAGTLLVIGGVHASGRHAMRNLLQTRALVWIGLRSYSLYLWHWPVDVLMRWTVGLDQPLAVAFAAALTLLAAAASYRWIEVPFRNYRPIERQPQWRRIAAFALLPIAGFAITSHWFYNRSRYSLTSVSKAPADWQASSRMKIPGAGQRQCQVDVQDIAIAGGFERRYTPHGCTVAVPKGRLFVLGDSHAGAISPMLELLSAEQGIAVTIYWTGGCAYLQLQRPMEQTGGQGCLAFSTASRDTVAEQAAAGDIVLLSSLRLQRYGDQWASFHVADANSTQPDPQAVQLRQAALADAGAWLRPFVDRRAKVLFMAPLPIFRAPYFRCADWFNRMNPICIGDNQQPRRTLDRLRDPVLAQLQDLANTHPDVHVWDPFEVLCPGPICYPYRDGRPLFFDGDHLSAYGNLVAYATLKAAIDKLNVAAAQPAQ